MENVYHGTADTSSQPGAKKRVSIKDVARAAGTSIATVSRILNASDHPVSEELRARVEEAAHKLEYRPNRMAQNLRNKQAGAVGLLVRDIADTYFSNIARGVTEEAGAMGLMPLVCSSKRNPELEIEFLYFLAQYQVAGIILAGAGWRDAAFMTKMATAVKDIQDMGIRIVACAPQGAPMPVAMVDNIAIGREAFARLHALGHKKIGLITGEDSNLSSHLRIEGFMEAAGAAGAAPDPSEMLALGHFSWEHGYRASRELMHRRPDITAFFCSNDNIAVGALRGLGEMGLSIPGDVSVLGVGDIDMAPYTTPPLSTFHIPFAEMGRIGVRMVVADGETPMAGHIFEAEYVERASVSRVGGTAI